MYMSGVFEFVLRFIRVVSPRVPLDCYLHQSSRACSTALRWQQGLTFGRMLYWSYHVSVTYFGPVQEGNPQGSDCETASPRLVYITIDMGSTLETKAQHQEGKRRQEAQRESCRSLSTHGHTKNLQICKFLRYVRQTHQNLSWSFLESLSHSTHHATNRLLSVTMSNRQPN